MTVSEQVAPVVAMLARNQTSDLDTLGLANGIERMAAEIDALRARLRLVALAVLLLAIGAVGVLLR